MEGKTKRGSTTQVKVTDDNDTVIELINKEGIKNIIVKGDEKLGHQTEGGIQLLSQKFTRRLGNCGERPGTKAVLEGTFNYPDSTTEATKDFLAACKHNIKIASVKNHDDTSNRFHNTRNLWNLRRGETSTYGTHIGHYKAVMKHGWLS